MAKVFKTYFQDAWMSRPEFSGWLNRAKEGDCNKAHCSLCHRDFSLSTMGIGAVKSHATSAKHKAANHGAQGGQQMQLTDMFNSSRLQPATPFLEKLVEGMENRSVVAASSSTTCTSPAPPTATVTSSTVTPAAQSTLSSHFGSREVQEGALRAETLWTLKAITLHYSMKSCEDMVKIFQLMFPDSEIAQKMTCGERKTSYIATFGLGSFLKDLLKKKLRGKKHYVILFDESLNEDLQEKQLDIFVRFWHEGKVEAHYATSVFLGHATAAILAEEVEEACREFGLSNLLQVSMDGPNVNWAMFKILSEHLSKEGDKQLINVGSCGLHTLHNAFRAGHEATGWKTDSLLTSLYYLFESSPARREDFMSNTGYEKFPLRFCRHRWVENVAVAERGMDFWPQFQSYFKAVHNTKQEPKNNSYSTLVRLLEDKLLMAKVQAFIAVAKEVEPLLKKFQTDAPALSFLCRDLANLMKSLMRRFIKESALKDIMQKQLLDLDLSKDNRTTDSIDVGFTTNRLLREARDQGAKAEEIVAFKLQFKNFLIALLKKLHDKSPMKYAVARNMDALTPGYILIALLKKLQDKSPMKYAMARNMEALTPGYILIALLKKLQDKSPMKYAMARNMEALTPGYILIALLKKLQDKSPMKYAVARNMEALTPGYILIALLKKLQDKSPIKYAVARNMEALTPGYMLEKPRGIMFSNLLNSLVDSKWLSCTEAEETERQYRSFCIDVAAKDVNFINFQDSDRLDSLFFRHLAGRTEYSSLWSVIEMTLILSHGQATVERGFSINSNTTKQI